MKKIITDGDMSGDSVYFTWNKQRKPQHRKVHVYKAPKSMSSAPLCILFQVAPSKETHLMMHIAMVTSQVLVKCCGVFHV